MFNKFRPKQAVQHIIGRVTYVWDSFWASLNINTIQKSIDETIPDYKFWDELRHCKASGYEIAGLFAQAVIDLIASWVIGRSVSIELAEVDDKRMSKKVEYTNDSLRRFMLANQGTIVTTYEDTLALGDQFALVNSDGSLAILAPNTVEVVYDDLDLDIVGYRVYTQTNKARIIDEYYSDRRIRTIEKTDQKTKQVVKTVQNFRVLIGRIPVVHFAYDRRLNERRGRPIYEKLLKLWSELNDIIIKGIQGTKVAGNPIPVFENLDDPNETISRLVTEDDESYIDKDGNEATRKQIIWDELTALVLGSGGQFKFAGPEPGFSQDILGMINMLFGLMLKHLHTPEYLWAQGRDFTEGIQYQTPGWVRFIEGLRDKFAGVAPDEKVGTKAKGGLHELAEVWLKTKALTDSQIFVGPTIIKWTDLTETDEKMTFEWVKYLVSRGFMTGMTALRTSQLVENIKEEYDKAQAELKALQEPESFDDFGGSDQDPLTSDTTPDERVANKGADSPRMPAFGGGGKTQ